MFHHVHVHHSNTTVMQIYSLSYFAESITTSHSQVVSTVFTSKYSGGMFSDEFLQIITIVQTCMCRCSTVVDSNSISNNKSFTHDTSSKQSDCA